MDKEYEEIDLTLTTEMWNFLFDRAEKEGISINEVINNLLIEYLEKMENEYDVVEDIITKGESV